MLRGARPLQSFYFPSIPQLPARIFKCIAQELRERAVIPQSLLKKNAEGTLRNRSLRICGVLLATFGTEMMSASPDRFAAQSTVVALTRPAEDVIIVPNLFDVFVARQTIRFIQICNW